MEIEWHPIKLALAFRKNLLRNETVISLAQVNNATIAYELHSLIEKREFNAAEQKLLMQTKVKDIRIAFAQNKHILPKYKTVLGNEGILANTNDRKQSMK